MDTQLRAGWLEDEDIYIYIYIMCGCGRGGACMCVCALPPCSLLYRGEGRVKYC